MLNFNQTSNRPLLNPIAVNLQDRVEPSMPIPQEKNIIKELEEDSNKPTISEFITPAIVKGYSQPNWLEGVNTPRPIDTSESKDSLARNIHEPINTTPDDIPEKSLESLKSQRRSNIDLSNVQQLQQMLMENEYDVGKTGDDGILGRNTIMALQSFLKDKGGYIGQDRFQNEGVDGVLGNITKQAIEKYNQRHSKPSIYRSRHRNQAFSDRRCNERFCAEFVTMESIRATGLPAKDIIALGITGHAWYMGQNIVNAGGQKIYDRFNKTPVTDLRPGDVVTIYTGGSSDYQHDANNTYSRAQAPSHSALIDSEIITTKDGRKFVMVIDNAQRSNTRRRWYLPKDGQEFQSTGGRHVIDGIYRPAYDNLDGIRYSKPNEDLKFREDIKLDYNLSENTYFDLAKATIGILETESGEISETRAKLLAGKEFISGIAKSDKFNPLANAVYRLLKGDSTLSIPQDEVSEGMGQTKLRTNLIDEDISRRVQPNRLESAYGLTEDSLSLLPEVNIPKSLEDVKNIKGLSDIVKFPEFEGHLQDATKATFLVLAENYTRLKNRYPDITEDQLLYLTIASYNRGNLSSPYGKEQKTTKEYSEDFDVGFVNRILSYIMNVNLLNVTSNDNYKTMMNNLGHQIKPLDRFLKSNPNYLSPLK